MSEMEQRSSEARATVDAAESRRIVGYPIVFNSLSRVMMSPKGKFVERVLPEAVDRTLQSGRSVKALWNHNSDLVLGSTRSGTLKLRKTGTALGMEIDPPLWAAPQLESVQRGDIDGMSFSFRVLDDDFHDRTADGLPIRTIHDMEFSEVSLVAFPAYEGTSVGMAQRSLDALEAAERSVHSMAGFKQWQKLRLAR